MRDANRPFALGLGAALALSTTLAGASCARPLYLTFDTGHMGVAPLIAQVLARQQVRVTFFAAQEKTREGDGTLGEHWAGWWRERAREGHAFASHTYEHAYWRADALDGSFRIRPSSGPQAGKDLRWSDRDNGCHSYCGMRGSFTNGKVALKLRQPLANAPKRHSD